LAGAQATQRAPPDPQSVLAVPGWQLPPASQQPLGQLAALHTHAPPAHACPAAQATQAAPLAPHCAVVVPATHDVPAQQPLAQSVESQ